VTNPQPRPITPDDLYSLRIPSDVQLSPDGARVAYVLTTIDREADEYRAAIWIVPAKGGEPVQFTRGAKNDSAPRWSPDGQTLAFLSDRDGSGAQLYVIPSDGGESRKLTALESGAGPAGWSPDGRRILFAARVLKAAPPADAEARKRWEQRPKFVTRGQYKDDGQGYTFDAVSQLFVVSLEGGEPQQLTHADVASRAPAWSPDGTQLAFSRNRDGAADYNLSDIWIADAGGNQARALTQSIGRATSPTWSPDGTLIACYGSEKQEAQSGDPLAHVWVVPLSGAEPRALTVEFDRGAVLASPPAVTPGPVWSGGGSTLTFGVGDEGNAPIVRVALAGGVVRRVVGGERQIVSSSASQAGNAIAFIASTPEIPGDVYICAWDGADERRLTHSNDELLSGLLLPRIERRKFANPNGGMLDGWLLHPVHATGRVPLLLDIHGGPHSFHGNAFYQGYFYRYALPARGWAVLLMNPTGSGSYGKVFADGIRGRWGEQDLPEQLAAVDALVAEGLADPERLAVCGYSYGGFMTSWTIGHTDRFKAAVIGAPVSNLESFYGASDIGMWFGARQMCGGLRDRRESYRRLSPVNYADRVSTPSLILHGEGDDRCPISQGEEYFIALLAAGKAPVQMVRYPGGSHLFISGGRPSHRVDFCSRVIDWVEKYTLKG
jgi:dipeptidyl aminopeptidase/acylaminoacyl peptidase